MESENKDQNSTSNEGLDEKFRDRQKNSSIIDDDESDSTEFGATTDRDKVRGYAERANIKSTLNEDKSTISDTSAPSASMEEISKE
jgi:hypothetical protein